MAVSRPAPRSVEYALDHKEYLNEILVREAEAARACEKKARQERSLEKKRRLEADEQRRHAQAMEKAAESRARKAENEKKKAKKCCEGLEADNQRLMAQNRKMEQTIADLEQTIRAKNREILMNKVRQERLDYLEEKLSSLGVLETELEETKKKLNKERTSNSTNSNFPTSHDHTSHTPRPDQKRVPVSSRPESRRKRGGQPGHPGHKSTLMDSADTVITKTVKRAPSGAEAVRSEDRTVLYYRVQKVSTITRAAVTETRYYIDPEGEDPCDFDMKTWKANPLRYSAEYKSIAIFMYQFGGMSIERVLFILESLFQNAPVPRAGTLSKWIDEFSEKAQTRKSEILNELLQEELVHVDETSVKISGELYWFHTITSRKRAFFVVTKCRSGREGGPVSILKSGSYSGKVVHDHFSPYLSLEGITHCECMVHIERYMRAGVEYDKCEECEQMLDLLHEMRERKAECIKAGMDRLTQSELVLFTERFKTICQKGMARWEEEVKKCPAKEAYTPDYYRTFRRMLATPEDYLRFITDFSVPFGNNAAERQMMAVKSRKKVSRQFVTEKGAGNYSDYLTLQQTAKLSGSNIYEMICTVMGQ